MRVRIKNEVLQIKSTKRMIGYLNAPSPFDENGWYNYEISSREEDFTRLLGVTVKSSTSVG